MSSRLASPSLEVNTIEEEERAERKEGRGERTGLGSLPLPRPFSFAQVMVIVAGTDHELDLCCRLLQRASSWADWPTERSRRALPQSEQGSFRFSFSLICEYSFRAQARIWYGGSMVKEEERRTKSYRREGMRGNDDGRRKEARERASRCPSLVLAFPSLFLIGFQFENER